MRTYALLLPVAISLLAFPANADEPTKAADPKGDQRKVTLEQMLAPYRVSGFHKAPVPPPEKPLAFDERFVLDTGRVPVKEAGPDTLSFQFHGEAQFRFDANNTLALQPAVGSGSGPYAVDPATGERRAVAPLGSHWRMVHWLRLKPIFQYSDKLKIVGEIDVPYGMVAGQLTQLVSASLDDSAKYAWYQVRPRQLYIEYTTPIGLIRAGQQTAHWGMGLVANDGDHPALFGNYRRGAIVERILFATKPMGKDSPLAIAVGGDLVYQDNRAQLVPDLPPSAQVTPADELGATAGGAPNPQLLHGRDRALQVIGAVRWKSQHLDAGVYGVYRYQERKAFANDELNPFKETLRVGVLDFAGKFNAPIAGSRAFVFGEYEVAYIAGKTNYVRNVELLQAGRDETIQTWGGSMKLGAVHVSGSGANAWGDVAVAFEWGYTSGDADPYDGVTRRFTMDPNHKVGLVLFDHVMAWKTARSATIAQDPRITYRPSPGLDFLPSEGGIFGATYINPTVVVRPKRWVDLKAGMVIAHTTADFVDPFQAGALGKYRNYDGGSAKKHDLGFELDLGGDVRIPVSSGFVTQLGVEGGVLVPGGAFEDATGVRLPNQYLLRGKLGVQF